MTVPVTQIRGSIEILSNILQESKYEKSAVRKEVSTIYAEIEYCHKDQWDTILETTHYTAFRKQAMGLPILGMLNNVPKINRDMIVNFHNEQYVGKNIIVTGAGRVDHDELVNI